MARRGRLSQEQILAILTDNPEDVSEFEEDDELDSDDDYFLNENGSSSSDPAKRRQDRSLQVQDPSNRVAEPNATSTVHLTTNEETDECVLKDIIASDGTEWKQIQADKRSAGRRSVQNILREMSGPTGHTKGISLLVAQQVHGD
ncbi:uncharacterized protein [Macrobrachium rosenbergii]|uniref:uncharacterized protein n=1 Tax=Macrobrachium rosenbergii TaxID=79674 RepID=UPI0034D66C50